MIVPLKPASHVQPDPHVGAGRVGWAAGCDAASSAVRQFPIFDGIILQPLGLIRVAPMAKVWPPAVNQCELSVTFHDDASEASSGMRRGSR